MVLREYTIISHLHMSMMKKENLALMKERISKESWTQRKKREPPLKLTTLKLIEAMKLKWLPTPSMSMIFSIRIGVAIRVRMSGSCRVKSWVFDYIGQH